MLISYNYHKINNFYSFDKIFFFQFLTENNLKKLGRKDNNLM